MVITGKHGKGMGRAHIVGRTDKVIDSYRSTFGCNMIGTFNIRLASMKERFVLPGIKPSIANENKQYWFVRISKEGKNCFGWIRRWQGYSRPSPLLEVITKELIPEHYHTGDLKIEIYERWDVEEIKNWAKDLYWWQSFDFSPIKRAESKFLWDTINIVSWSGCSVLDVGCHYGYHSFQASKRGARVTAFDKGSTGIKEAKVIRDKIIHEDVNFIEEDPGGLFDIILYLSVHQQVDPDYNNLEDKINELKSRARKHFFVELIVPPLFPRNKSMTEMEIDKAVGGVILARYQHKVRGIRKVYHIVKD